MKFLYIGWWILYDGKWMVLARLSIEMKADFITAHTAMLAAFVKQSMFLQTS